MKSFFTSEFFLKNRQVLQANSGDDLLVFAANGLLQRGADSPFPFVQDANFWYVSGLDEPDLVLVLDTKESFIIVPGRSVSRQAFDGSVSFEEIQKRSGVNDVYEAGEGWQKLSQKLKKRQSLGGLTVPPAYFEQLGLYTNPARQQLYDRLLVEQPSLKINDVGFQLRRQRAIKQPEELRAIQKAIDITTKSLQALDWKTYRHEYEVEAALSQSFRVQGARGHAFEPIVASGKHACTLHYVANNGRLEKDQLVVLDIGAEVDHYAADITRTVACGRPTERQQAVHAAVRAVQDYACTLLKPGVYLKEYEQQVREVLESKLGELGLRADNSHRYYPHATSHFLGLNVHDVGEYDQPLEPGMVLTVEPGIYIAEEGIGVRIEDDVLITKAGNKMLSGALPRDLA